MYLCFYVVQRVAFMLYSIAVHHECIQLLHQRFFIRSITTEICKTVLINCDEDFDAMISRF